ncbi:MAG: glycosyl hydrolase 53 family protein [Lachnospiraceae bacterium]
MKKYKWIIGSLVSVLIFGLTGCQKEAATTKVSLSTSEPEIFVEAVSDMPEDFVLGADVSTLLAQEKSGVRYYNEEGQEQDLLLTLAENGINTIRIRVWNDPYDADGNGYGGGNNDVDTAVEIGKRASKYGLHVMVDFHYSDFWADPSKQMAPKAWDGMTAEEKKQAAYEFTRDSLKKMLDAGIDITLVQIGNEITNGLSGETKWSDRCRILTGAAEAVREVSKKTGKEILIAVHFTNPETPANYERYAQMLNKFEIDYDIFASSYYPYWHGTTENLKEILKKIGEGYQKKVMVAEVSYAYTMEDGDGFGNTISKETVCELPYPVTVQGQADAVRDVVQAVVDTGDAGMGVIYWEPAWIPVPAESQEEREECWKTFGSGWASIYSADYDPEDAGVYYGGSAWDNQALFDFEGHPLASLSVFRFLRSGATTDLKMDDVRDISVKVRMGDEVKLPQTTEIVLNNGEIRKADVTWNLEGVQIDNTKPGEYRILGTVHWENEEHTTFCTVKIVEKNYVENPGFEDKDLSMWVLNNVENQTTELFVSEKSVDAVEGSKSMHFYSTNNVAFTMEQTITNLNPGTYKYTMAMHGGDAGSQAIEIYAYADGKEYHQEFAITQWQDIKHPVIEAITTTDGTITIGVKVQCNAGAWGNLDEFLLAPVE